MVKEDEPWAWLNVEKQNPKALLDEPKPASSDYSLAIYLNAQWLYLHRDLNQNYAPGKTIFREYDPGAPIILDREQDRILVELLAHLEEGGTLQEFCEARGELRYPTEHKHKPYQLTMRRYRQWAANFYQLAYDEIPINDPLPWYKPIVIEPEPRWTPPEEIEGVCYQGHQLETHNRDGRAVCINGHEA